MKNTQVIANQRRLYCSLATITLAISNILIIDNHALAEDTNSGTQIINRATVTYEDPNNQSEILIQVFSNPVVTEATNLVENTLQNPVIELFSDDSTKPNNTENINNLNPGQKN